MRETSSSLLPVLLSAGTVAAAIAVAFGVARAAQRRERRERRLRHDELVALMSRPLDSRDGRRELRRAAREADEAGYWWALETVSARLRPALRARLARVLARNAHAAAEHRHLRHESPWRRELAVHRLELLRSPRILRALRSALVRGPEFVSASAARALARRGDVGALRWILRHPDRLTNRSAAMWNSLLRGFGRRGLPVLAESLERGIEDRRLLRAAIEALGTGRYRRARDTIERHLGHENLEVRVGAARALGRLEAVPCAPALLAALDDEAWQVRAQAAWALGRARVPQALGALQACLTDPAWWVRRHAAYALTRLGVRGIEALRSAAEHSHDPYARDIAREALDLAAQSRA